MDFGSLYDLLHNETMAIDGELIPQFCRTLLEEHDSFTLLTPKLSTAT